MGPLRNVVTTVFTLLASVGLVAVATVLVTKNAVDGDRDLRAYEAAPRCRSAPSAPAECLWMQEFTVFRIHLYAGKGDHTRAFLISAYGTRLETTYQSDGPVVNRLHEGDRVTGIIWRGRLTEITASDAAVFAAQKTTAAPVDWRARSFTLALVIAPSGLLTTVVCAWRLLRRRAVPTPTLGMDATLALAILFFIVGLFSIFLTSIFVVAIEPPPASDIEIFWLTEAVWLPTATILTTLVRRNVKKRTRPS